MFTLGDMILHHSNVGSKRLKKQCLFMQSGEMQSSGSNYILFSRCDLEIVFIRVLRGQIRHAAVMHGYIWIRTKQKMNRTLNRIEFSDVKQLNQPKREKNTLQELYSDRIYVWYWGNSLFYRAPLWLYFHPYHPPCVFLYPPPPPFITQLSGGLII